MGYLSGFSVGQRDIGKGYFCHLRHNLRHFMQMSRHDFPVFKNLSPIKIFAAVRSRCLPFIIPGIKLLKNVCQVFERISIG